MVRAELTATASIRRSSRGLGIASGIAGGEGVQRWVATANRRLRRGKLWVGFQNGATYPDGTPVAMVAAVQDFGSSSQGIPPRPFFRNSVAEHKKEWPRTLAKLLRDEKMDTQRALGVLGEEIAGQIRQSIVDLHDPPLKPATVRRKGFEKPLIDTSLLLHSVTYDVKD
jgi:hypothetical protein